MTTLIPGKCKLVHDALSGKLGQTEYSQINKRWRYVDLINITGRSSSERKLRELINACPGLVTKESVKGPDGTRYNTFWIAEARQATGVARCQVKPATGGNVLFQMPAFGRPE